LTARETTHDGTQHNDTQQNDTQQNDIQHNETKNNENNDTQHNDTQHNGTKILIFSKTIQKLAFFTARGTTHDTDCCYAKCHSAECHI
jgi:hypothetical protein